MSITKERLTNLQEELSKGRNEVARQRETLASLEEELKVCKNNAKTKVSDLEYSFTQMKTEKQEMQQEVDTLRDHIDQLQVDCDRFLEEKATDTANVTQLEAKLDTAQARVYELDGEMAELRQKYWSEQEEWRQFQSDLQMAVVIANEIKVETEEDVEKLNHDNKTLKERCTLLEDQNHRVQEELHRLQMKTESKLAGPGRSDLRDRMLSSFDHDLAMLTCSHTLSGPEAKATSVKNLIATIEKQVKSDMGTPPESPAHTGSRRNSADSNVSLGSFKSDASPKGLPIRHGSLTSATALHKVDSKDSRAFSHRHTLANIIYESAPVTDDTKAVSPSSSSGDSVKMSRASSIRSAKSVLRRSGEVEPKPDKAATSQVLRSDPLGNLAKQMGGSKRNALLKWCQARTASYTGIDITNFSSSWNDGLAFCALLHTYLKDKIPYKRLSSQNKLENFTVVFKAAESVGIPSILNISDMVSMERPDWQAVMSYVTSIYKHFEVDKA
ncbi:Cytospin-A [Lamellibrachia satsuma]|nr:Cytospin-A [Lamellibrachia satsuma]